MRHILFSKSCANTETHSFADMYVILYNFGWRKYSFFADTNLFGTRTLQTLIFPCHKYSGLEKLAFLVHGSPCSSPKVLKYWNKFRYSCIRFFLSQIVQVQLEHVITCSWNEYEELRILRKLSLIKKKKSVFRLRCNRKAFVWNPSLLLLCSSRLHVSTATHLTIVCLQM